jgi:ribonuclease BN (tRNA processing enzyme)
MQLNLLGTTGYHPNNLRHTACMMLPECGVILDAGTGMFRARDLLQTDTLDIFLTHTHLDHIVGLTFLLDVLFEKEMRRVDVHGEAEKLKAVDQHLYSEHIFPVRPTFRWRPLEDHVRLRDGGRVSWFPLKHPGGSVGYRFDWPGCSMAYVTDTTADPQSPYVDKIRGVDVLLHECHFPDGWEELAEKTGHSCLTPAAQVARAADVGRLILVHINPMSSEIDPYGVRTARNVFPATEIGTDGMIVEF